MAVLHDHVVNHDIHRVNHLDIHDRDNLHEVVDHMAVTAIDHADYAHGGRFGTLCHMMAIPGLDMGVKSYGIVHLNW